MRFFCKDVEEPDRPSVVYEQPIVKVSKEIKVKSHGNYKTKSGQAKGLIVHYTAGRNHVGAAKSTLADMARRNLGCLVMDITGEIYRSYSQPLNKVAFHAGKSEKYGTVGLSYYCMGMEICNPGLLEKEGDSFKTWYGATVPSHAVRQVNQGQDYLVNGYFEKYSDLQERALINFCLWQKDVNPEFDFDWVLGHDEVCVPRGRKTDPGGALSMPMPKFRAHLKALWAKRG